MLVVVIGGGIWLHSSPASAEGRFPRSNQIVFSPSNENRIVLRTTYGILPSHDNGASWAFICEDAFGYSELAPVIDPPIALMNDNSLIVGTPNGMSVSAGAGLGSTDDPGCNWNCIPPPLSGQMFVDEAVRPDMPSSAVAISWTSVPTDSGVPTFSIQVFETTDNASTWNAIGTPLDPLANPYTIDVTKTDPNRLYVSATTGDGSSQAAVLYVSMDKGQTWKTNQLSPQQYDPTLEQAIFIGGVDPTDANRLYLRSQSVAAGGISRLTTVDVASDGTATFATTKVFEVEAGPDFAGEFLGFALSPDGSKIYVGTAEQGLWVAPTATMNFQQNSKITIQCLATRETSKGTELWACSEPADGFVAGVSYDDGKTFTPKLPLVGSLTGPVACSPNTTDAGNACGESINGSQCARIYQDFCEDVPCGVPDASTSADAEGTSISDAAPSSGGSDATASSDSSGTASDNSTSTRDGSTSTEAKSSSGCSCDLAANQGGEGAAFGAVTALAAIAQRRRQRRRNGGRQGRT